VNNQLKLSDAAYLRLKASRTEILTKYAWSIDAYAMKAKKVGRAIDKKGGK